MTKIIEFSGPPLRGGEYPSMAGLKVGTAGAYDRDQISISMLGDAKMTREEVDAKITASEARSETRFAEMRGEMNTGFAAISAKLDMLASSMAETKSEMREASAETRSQIRDSQVHARAENVTTRWTVLGTGIAVAALLLGMLAYGGDEFGRGAEISAKIEESVTRILGEKHPVETPKPPAAAQ